MQAFELFTSWGYIHPLLVHSQLAYQEKMKINKKSLYTSRKHIPLSE